MIEFLRQPWPWYVSGIVAGLIVPALLILGNKHFGISANFRHICAACIPGKLSFFKYDWKRERWNLFFVAGTLLGAAFTSLFLSSAAPIQVDGRLVSELGMYGVSDYNHLVPEQLFSLEQLFKPRGFLLMVVGGFLVGFGSRYAGGCTSGHTIMGLSTRQLPSLVATICFMLGGLIMANFILPHILSL